MIKYLILILVGSAIAVLYPTATYAQQYEFTQRITALTCVASEIDSGGVVLQDLHPEECQRMPGAPIVISAPMSKAPGSVNEPVSVNTKEAEQGHLAPTGSPVYYILFIGMILAAGTLLCTRKHVKILIFYHKHDNIEVLDHKKQKQKSRQK